MTKGRNEMDKQNAREGGRVVLAHGEVTGHCHEVVTEAGVAPSFAEAQYFDGPVGRELIALTDGLMERHDEHGVIELNRADAERGAEALRSGEKVEKVPGFYRQGDVLLLPTGFGSWRVIRQRQLEPEGWRQVAD